MHGGGPARPRGYHPWLFMLALGVFFAAAVAGDVLVALVGLVSALWTVGAV